MTSMLKRPTTEMLTSNASHHDTDVLTHIDRFEVPVIPSRYHQLIHLPTVPMTPRENPLPYEDGSLYILLSLLPGQSDRWHWSFFVMISHPYGQLYQVVSTQSASCQCPSSSPQAVSKGRWIFCEDMTAVIADERAVILALEIAKSLSEEDIAVLDEIVKATRVASVGDWSERWGEEFSCRTWIKDVLENLRMVAEAGEVVIVPSDCDVAGLESEATLLAKGCMRLGERRLLTSKQISD